MGWLSCNCVLNFMAIIANGHLLCKEYTAYCKLKCFYILMAVRIVLLRIMACHVTDYFEQTWIIIKILKHGVGI